MAYKSYYEKLKDPRWQKKRLEIMEKAGWRCRECGATDKTLHVNHSYYEKGLNPWEYPDHSLICLCARCHKDTEEILAIIHRRFGGMTTYDLFELYHAAAAISQRRTATDAVKTES